MQRAIKKKSPGNLIITLYQLSKFEAPSCNGFWDIKFSMTKFAKGDNSTKIYIFFSKFPPGYLLLILYKLSKFEAPSCNGFWDIKFSMSKFAKGND